jgi:hypothetical protein
MKNWTYSPALNFLGAKCGIAPRYIANFDSATAALRALSNYLREKDFPGVGVTPAFPPLASFLNRLPKPILEMIYKWSGQTEAIPASQLKNVRAEIVSQWFVSKYPKRFYEGVMIGSASGAAVHLCAALGLPWLPQTFLIPVKHNHVHPDEPKEALKAFQKEAKEFLKNNPDLQLHHMHDPNQDRLMVQRMLYFRMKRLRLGETYERFLEDHLTPGGTIFLLECQRTWPTVQIADRYIFQHGALGGATPEEFLQGSSRVEDFLSRYHSHKKRWDSPSPDGKRPEAEWGFEAALREDVIHFAQKRGYRVRRIIFQEPEHLSPLVADLYRWWYKKRGYRPNRLLVESFMLLEPYWTLQTGSVPFWMKFNMEPSAETLERYLDTIEPYDEIFLMLFSHGVDSVGLASIDRWKSILNRARKRSSFIGVNEAKFPRDFSVFVNYLPDLKSKIPARYPLPGALSLNEMEQFLRQSEDKYPVQFL